MPNHVHLILQPLKNEYDSYYLLAEIMSSIKSYTARRCNEVLKRNGQFWEYESYDHAIRDDLDFSRQLYYLVNNPVKAGYVNDYSDWQYTWVCESYREEM
jgi:REP element-mobilizing transposase RayT